MDQDNNNQSTPPTNPPSPPPATPPPPTPGPAPAPPPTTEPPQDMGVGNPPTDMGVGNPKIGVELEEKKAPATPPKSEATREEPAKIEVATTDIPIKSYDQNRTNEPLAPASVPVSPALGGQGAPADPVSAPPAAPAVKISSGSPGSIITVLAIMALIIGSVGGFFGFRYWDNLKTSAATESSPSPTALASETPSLDVSTWSTYSSTLYNFTLKYPNGWSASTTDPNADSIIFASNQESVTGDLTGFRIEIGFQDANGKTLKSWVEANSVTTNNRNPAREITVDDETAYQQNISKPQVAVTTYIARGEKIMTVTYSAPEEMMSEGGDWYNNLINSITLA